jgi:hypothetical protein
MQEILEAPAVCEVVEQGVVLSTTWLDHTSFQCRAVRRSAVLVMSTSIAVYGRQTAYLKVLAVFSTNYAEHGALPGQGEVRKTSWSESW